MSGFIKSIIRTAGLALTLSGAACNPSVEECRDIVEAADAAEKAGKEASKAKLAEETKATAAQAAAATRTETTTEPQVSPERRKEQHDADLRIVREKDLISIMFIHVIEIDSKKEGSLYTTDELSEMPELVRETIRRHPSTAFDHNINPDEALFGIVPSDEAFKNNPPQKIAEMILESLRMNGESNENMQIDIVGRVIKSAEKKGVVINRTELQPLIDRAVKTHAEKGLKKIAGNSYDYMSLNNLGDVIQSAKDAGFTVDMSQLQPLVDHAIVEHKKKAGPKDYGLKDMTEAAKKAGFTVAE